MSNKRFAKEKPRNFNSNNSQNHGWTGARDTNYSACTLLERSKSLHSKSSAHFLNEVDSEGNLRAIKKRCNRPGRSCNFFHAASHVRRSLLPGGREGRAWLRSGGAAWGNGPRRTEMASFILPFRSNAQCTKRKKENGHL